MKLIKKLSAVLIAAAILLTGCADGSTSSSGSETGITSSAAEGTSSADSSAQSSADSSSQAETTAQTTPSANNSSSSSEPTESSSADVSQSESKPAESNPAESTTVTSAATTTTAPAAEKQSIEVSYTISSTWQEGGMECTQLDFTVRNNTSADIGSWDISINFGQETDAMQQWNVNLTDNGSVLRCQNVEYNGTVAAGGETTFGVIVKTRSPVTAVKITADGSTVTAQPENTAAPQQTSQQQTTTNKPAEPPVIVTEDTPSAGTAVLVSEGGQLSVKGADLVDKNGNKIQLRGVSTHGVQWFPQYVNKDVFRELRDEWNVNTIRLAMYSGAGEGYTDSTKAGIEKTVQDAVDACIELDMYVIIDWHVLQDQSPQVRKADALRFFKYMSERYAAYPNVIYEICNEPNGYATWEGDVKPYAEEVIPVIRANDPDSVIIVGTPTWSQDIDKALGSPLKYDNVMYALHYYAATHTDWLRDRMKKCYNSGLPIFVSEFGNCDASGGGSNNWNEAQKWFDLMDELNISYLSWAMADKAETCCMLKPGASTSGGWTDNDLTDNGKHMKEWFRNHK